MRGLELKRTRYAGSDFSLFSDKRRFKSGGSSAPPAIDPAALAQSQVSANQQTAQTQSALNNVNTFSPLGATQFSQDPSGRWNLSQQLSPGVQNVFNNQSNLAQVLAGQGGNVANFAASPAELGANLVGMAGNLAPAAGAAAPTLQMGLNFSGLGSLPSSATDFGAPITDAQNAAYNTQAGYLDPQFAQKRNDLSQQLADQGIQPGTEAYSRAQGDLGRQETLAYQQAKDAAVSAGQAEQGRLFGEQLGARQQGAGEIEAGGQFANTAAQQAWQDPLTALSSIAGTGTGILGSAAQDLSTLNPLSGFEWAGSLPTFGGSPTTVSPANVVGAGLVGAQSAANRFTAGNTLNNQLFNGLGSLGGAVGLGNGGLGNLLFGAGGLSGLLSGGGAAAAAPAAGLTAGGFTDPVAALLAGIAA